LPEEAAKKNIHVIESRWIYQTPQLKNGSLHEHSGRVALPVVEYVIMQNNFHNRKRHFPFQPFSELR